MFETNIRENAISYLKELAEKEFENTKHNIEQLTTLSKKSPAQAKLDLKEAEQSFNAFIENISSDKGIEELLQKELPLPHYVRTLKNPSLKNILDFKLQPQYREIIEEENSYRDYVKTFFQYEYDEKAGCYALKSPFKTPKLGNF